MFCLQKNAHAFSEIKQQYDLKAHDLHLCKERLQHTTHFQHQEDAKNLENTIGKVFIIC